MNNVAGRSAEDSKPDSSCKATRSTFSSDFAARCNYKEENMDPLFQVHRLNEQGLQRAEAIAAIFEKTLAALTYQCGNGSREWALVRTKLEEACFFAKKAMSADPANQA